MNDKQKIEARAVAVLYRDFYKSAADTTDALMSIDELAYRIHPERQAYARQVVREMIRDDSLPVDDCMDGKCIEFLIEDADALTVWAMNYVANRKEQKDLLPL